MQRCTDPLTAYVLDSFPHKKLQRRWNCIKEGEIAYRPVSRFTACVCAFFIGANSSACKRSADGDPVLHNSQFVDVQIKLTAEYAQALFFVKAFAWQLFFQEEEDTSSFGFTTYEGNKNSLLVFGWKPDMNEWKHRSTFFPHWWRMYVFFSTLVQGTGCHQLFENQNRFFKRLTISWLKEHAKIPPKIQDLGNLPSI